MLTTAMRAATPIGATPAPRAATKTRACTTSSLRASKAETLGCTARVHTTSAFMANAVARRDVRAHAGARRPVVMAAKVAGYIKLAIEAGKANPAPPIGPALGAKVCVYMRSWCSCARMRRACVACARKGRDKRWVKDLRG